MTQAFTNDNLKDTSKCTCLSPFPNKSWTRYRPGMPSSSQNEILTKPSRIHMAIANPDGRARARAILLSRVRVLSREIAPHTH